MLNFEAIGKDAENHNHHANFSPVDLTDYRLTSPERSNRARALSTPTVLDFSEHGDLYKTQSPPLHAVQDSDTKGKVADQQHVQNPAPENPLLATTSAWEQQVYLKARESLSPTDFQQFQQLMTTFDSRNLPAAQKDGVYSQVDRLLEAKTSAIPQAELTNLAAQILLEAGSRQVGQGDHNACTVASLEAREWNRAPDKAATTIVEAALSGSWRAPDGKEIKLPAAGLMPLPGIESSLLGGEERTLASQIFQLVTVNDILQRLNPPIIYSGKDGDILRSTEGKPVTIDGSDTFKGLPPSLVEQAAERNFGDSEAFIVNKDLPGVKTHMLQFGSAQELSQALTSAKQFPLLIPVDGRKIFGELGVPNDRRL